MSMDEEPTILALSVIDGNTTIQTTYDPISENIYTEVYCAVYHRQFITVALSLSREGAMRQHNYWVGIMAADIQPTTLMDIVSRVVYTKRW